MRGLVAGDPPIPRTWGHPASGGKAVSWVVIYQLNGSGGHVGDDVSEPPPRCPTTPTAPPG